MSEFIISNFYPNHGVRVESGNLSVDVARASRLAVPWKTAMNAFKKGASVKIYILLPKPTLLVTYQLNQNISQLHVGQITTRFAGGTWDDQIVVASNAVQGRPYIHIWNTTHLPLRLNNNIYVRPFGVFRYKGRDNFGVPLGLVLEDPDKIYPALRITKPVTDVYYGLASETAQPIYGGWQTSFSTEVDYGNYYDAYRDVIFL